jgi:hypothetical protein
MTTSSVVEVGHPTHLSPEADGRYIVQTWRVHTAIIYCGPIHLTCITRELGASSTTACSVRPMAPDSPCSHWWGCFSPSTSFRRCTCGRWPGTRRRSDPTIPRLSLRSTISAICVVIRASWTRQSRCICEGMQELDGERVSTFRYAQYTVGEGIFLARSEVLLFSCLISL